MAAPRKRTVLTPPPPPRARKTTKTEEVADRTMAVLPGTRYRCRPTSVNPFGTFDPATYGDDLDEQREIAAQLIASGVPAVVERRIPAGYGSADEREPVMVSDLAKLGLAREVTITLRKLDGTTRDDTRWVIEPKGWEILRGKLALPDSSQLN